MVRDDAIISGDKSGAIIWDGYDLDGGDLSC